MAPDWATFDFRAAASKALPLLCYFWATFDLLAAKCLEIERLCEKLSISCQFRGILNLFNVNEQIYRQLIALRRWAIEGDYPQILELDNLSFFHPIGWFLVNLPHKNAQN